MPVNSYIFVIDKNKKQSIMKKIIVSLTLAISMFTSCSIAYQPYIEKYNEGTITVYNNDGSVREIYENVKLDNIKEGGVINFEYNGKVILLNGNFVYDYETKTYMSEEDKVITKISNELEKRYIAKNELTSSLAKIPNKKEKIKSLSRQISTLTEELNKMGISVYWDNGHLNLQKQI